MGSHISHLRGRRHEPTLVQSGCPVRRSEQHEILRARHEIGDESFMPRLDNTSYAEEEHDEVHVSGEFFTETMGKLSSVVPYVDSMKPPTIYRVPEELKSRYEDEGHKPVVVHLGVLNYSIRSSSSIDQLEDYKWCCVRQLIRQFIVEPDETPMVLRRCLDLMKSLGPRVRASYSRGIGIEDDELARMMLLDGCFILHRLLKYARRGGGGGKAHQSGEDEDDYDWTQVFGRIWVWQLVTRDLLLLENQIPFFVLVELFKQLTKHEPDDALVKGSLQLFMSLCPHMLKRHPPGITHDKVHHLLHLFYLSVVSSPYYHRRKDNVLLSERPQWIPCAKELEEAGIRFRKRDDAKSFLEIKFEDGLLEIPPLELYDNSDALFQNLIAFEQTYPDTKCYVSAYAIFMDCLVNTPEDMRILHLRGILVNKMNGQMDASRFFNRICKQVHCSEDNYLVSLMDHVREYTECRRHKWRAALVRDYCSNPWVAISLLAAVLLLAMTVLQTFFTVYPYFKPPN